MDDRCFLSRGTPPSRLAGWAGGGEAPLNLMAGGWEPQVRGSVRHQPWIIGSEQMGCGCRMHVKREEEDPRQSANKHPKHGGKCHLGSRLLIAQTSSPFCHTPLYCVFTNRGSVPTPRQAGLLAVFSQQCALITSCLGVTSWRVHAACQAFGICCSDLPSAVFDVRLAVVLSHIYIG